MIDAHCHLLPSIDDGARDLATAIAMARMAVADGITTIACTPHIFPGVYDNTGPAIQAALSRLVSALGAEGIPLHLVAGADVHIAPGLIAGLADGRILTLGGSRYLLLELPNTRPPPRAEQTVFELIAADYQPILTHPERLSWIENEFDLIRRMVRCGAWIQVTAGSLRGVFGRRARYWSERLLDEGFVHIIATDAHDTSRRPPLLHEARHLAAARLGEGEATCLVETRPYAILSNAAPSTVQSPPAAVHALRRNARRWGFWGKKKG